MTEIIDQEKYHYMSEGQLSDVYALHGENWDKKALEQGFEPYMGDDGFRHWKLRKKVWNGLSSESV